MNKAKKQKIQKKQQPIDKATAQALLHLVKMEVSSLENSVHFRNHVINEYWEQSIPTDETTQWAFDALNATKNEKRVLSARIRKMAKISKELKEYLKAK